jgi:hypothetical protein
MRRYLGICVGLGLVIVVLSATNAGPALAQGALKPVMAFIVNDSAHPVPTTNIEEPTVTCTVILGGLGGVQSPFNEGGQFGAPPNAFVCPPGVTSIDVSRIAYTPELGAIPSSNVATFRMTVGYETEGFDLTPRGILAIVTNGTPEAAVMRPFRFSLTDTGNLMLKHSATSGIAEFAPTISGVLILIGTPVL